MAQQLYSRAKLMESRNLLIKYKHREILGDTITSLLTIMSYYFMYKSAKNTGSAFIKIINNDIDKSWDDAVINMVFPFIFNYFGIRNIKDIINSKEYLYEIKEVILVIDKFMDRVDELSEEELISMNNKMEQSFQKIYF